MYNRIPPPTNENVSKSMRSNKGKGTKPELVVRKMLRDMGYPGYRLNWKNAPGHPDIAYPGRRIAIFVNGCFWHHCPKCDLPMPKSHQDYWIPKIERNVQRDAEKNRELVQEGWTVITIWECQLKKEPEDVANRLKSVFLPRIHYFCDNSDLICCVNRLPTAISHRIPYDRSCSLSGTSSLYAG